MEKDIKALEEKSIPKLILSFSATVFAALLFNSIYTLTDALFVSRGVGDNAMGGVSVVFPFVILQGAISTTVGQGAASIVSRLLGEGKKRDAGTVTFNAMMIFYISAIIITALGFTFMNPMLKLMGVTNDILPLAKEYFTIILAGNIFSTGFSSIIRAEGKITYGLLIWVIPISINIILDAVFILVLNWGIKGSALATVIGQFTSAMMSVIFFAKISSLDFSKIKLNFKKIKDIVTTGAPSLIQMGSLSVISLIMNKTLSRAGGTMGINCFAYISKIITFAIVPLTSISMALAPVAGYNYGAKKPERCTKAIRFCILISVLYSSAVLIIIQVIPQYFIKIFTQNSAIITEATTGIRIVSSALLFAPFPLIAGSYSQAIGNKKWAFIMFGSNLIFLIPLLFIIPKYSGINGIWWSYAIANIGAAILTLVKKLP